MKTLLKMLPALALILLSASCLAQKGTTDGNTQTKAETKAVVSQVLYDQAIKALDGHQFIIQAKEFFYPCGRHEMKASLDSYISMQGSNVVVEFEQNARRYMYLDSDLITKDSEAKLIKGKVKKNGDAQYVLTMKSQDRRLISLKMAITLHKNSNKCSVRLDNNNHSHVNNVTTIKGEVYPFNDSAVAATIGGDIVD